MNRIPFYRTRVKKRPVADVRDIERIVVSADTLPSSDDVSEIQGLNNDLVGFHPSFKVLRRLIDRAWVRYGVGATGLNPPYKVTRPDHFLRSLYDDVSPITMRGVNDSITLFGRLNDTTYNQRISIGRQKNLVTHTFMNSIGRYYFHIGTVAGYTIKPPQSSSYIFLRASYSYFVYGNLTAAQIGGEEMEDALVLSTGQKISMKVSNKVDTNLYRVTLNRGFVVRSGQSLTFNGGQDTVFFSDIIVRDDAGDFPIIFDILRDGEEMSSLRVTGTSHQLVGDLFDMRVGDRIVCATPADMPYAVAFIIKDDPFGLWLSIGGSNQGTWSVEEIAGRFWDVWSSPVFEEDFDLILSMFIGDAV